MTDERIESTQFEITSIVGKEKLNEHFNMTPFPKLYSDHYRSRKDLGDLGIQAVRYLDKSGMLNAIVDQNDIRRTPDLRIIYNVCQDLLPIPHIGVYPLNDRDRIVIHDFKPQAINLSPTSISTGRDAVDFKFSTFSATVWYKPSVENTIEVEK
jgi:hypothetical protein